MHIGSTEILDTHAEAFAAYYARLVVTAVDDHWLDAALGATTGYGTSIIGCDAEVGVEQRLAPSDTPDGRPGAAVLLFARAIDALANAAANRVGQCVLTCPTTACFNGLPDATQTIPLGKYVRFFGDGFETRVQTSASSVEPGAGGRDSRCLIPVMDGEFVVDSVAGVAKGVAGGNLILQADTHANALAAALRAAGAIAPLSGVITPFPGGVCRSGSKVGSKYKSLIASTAEDYCPTLRGQVATQLVDGATCAYEIVIDGVSEAAVAAAMRAGIHAAAGDGVLAIGAGNFGGRLGKIRLRLHHLLSLA
jgi:formylmethanofuran--tetrahydromethanopterin N-formyltransferase